MSPDVRLTVQEILENRNFRDAEVIAGKEGLQRTVKWIHIMEVTGIEELLDGGELILSTGVGWKESEELFLAFFEQLIDSGAAGICIELGTYIPKIPNKIIHLANRYQFPLIVFNHKVRFVDITQDLHSILIKKHYLMISDLEEYSNQLNQLLLKSNSEQKILKFLHAHLKLDVIYVPNHGEIQILSNKSVKEQDQILLQLKKSNHSAFRNIANQPIQALNQKLADLFIISETDTVSEYEKIILDRTATALAQNTLRELYFEERRKTREAEWIQKWLDGISSDEQIYKYITDAETDCKPQGCVALLLKMTHLDENNLDVTHIKILFRSVFLQQGFTLFSTIRKNYLIFILVNKRKNDDWKKRIQSGINQIQKSLEFQPKIAVGRFVEKLSEIKKSHRTAEETSIIHERKGDGSFSGFYDDLHIYRLFSSIGEQDLQDFIHDYLSPIIKYDQENKGKLIETLTTYLKCNGSKKETARNLFIVRQTLYQRLQKIAELLGEDFMDSTKRQAIEFAITAYNNLSPLKTH